MSYKIFPTPDFKRHFKKLLKKYPSLKDDIGELIETLRVEPRTGFDLGNNVYKIRLAISSKNKGKSGGGRVITYIIADDLEIYLVDIYDKGQIDTLTKKQIFEILNRFGLT